MVTKSSSGATVVRVKSDQKEVACYGGGGALGHPLIYLPFGQDTEVICYYCGRRFEKSTSKN